MTDPTGGSNLGMMGADRLINQVRQRLADGRRMPTVPGTVDGLGLGKATKVAKDFEAVFTTQMISQMFKDVPIGMFGGGFGEKIWREHLYSEFGKAMADSSPLGVGRQVLQQILQMQGKQQPEIDALVKQALPDPLTAAAAHRKQIGPDAAAETAAATDTSAGGATGQQAQAETVRERAGSRAAANAVDPTPTMARIDSERHGVAPTPRDALYDKTPDGRAIPTTGAVPVIQAPVIQAPVIQAPVAATSVPADTGLVAAADRPGAAATMTTSGTAVPPGAVVHTPLPVGVATRPSGAPVPLFPSASAAGSSVGRSLLAAMKAGNRGIAAGRPMPTGATGADGPPVTLLPERPAAITDLPAQTAAVAGPRTEWGS